MAKHHEPFNALAPIEWSTVSLGDEHVEGVEGDANPLAPFLRKTFRDVETVIESIPVPPSLNRSPSTGRMSRADSRLRSHTESSAMPIAMPLLSPAHSIDARDHKTADKIRPEWKEVKINPRDNPLDINVYKLAAKDGKGSWFARRSLHDGLSFERWRLALEREFAESLKVMGNPGDGNIRGIGAERRIEMDVCDGIGRVEVYQLSAQFPGPTTPRDFVTLLLSSDPQRADENGMRQFTVISKPCSHPECPQRPGFIRGQYESVEVIREIPLAHSTRRARSSVDLRGDPSTQPTQSTSKRSRRELENVDIAIEWLMVTRSDPGGSVPRFMVEKGTPSGIVSDAGRFLNWATVKEPKSFANTEAEGSKSKNEAIESDRKKAPKRSVSATAIKTTATAITTTAVKPTRAPQRRDTIPEHGVQQDLEGEDGEIQNPGGFYSMMASAIGAASVAVTNRLPNSFSGAISTTMVDKESGSDEEEGFLASTVTDDDKSSVHTFTSAVEPSAASEEPPPPEKEPTIAIVKKDLDKETGARPLATVLSQGSRASSFLSAATTAHMTVGGSSSSKRSYHEKEMRKLGARRQKLNEKLSRIQARTVERDAAAREKAEKEAARLEAKYQKDIQKLEQKRLVEEKKSQERIVKQQEREDKKKVQLELDKTKTERDIAISEIKMLKMRVGELQGQNTSLVAQLGRLGFDVKDQALY